MPTMNAAYARIVDCTERVSTLRRSTATRLAARATEAATSDQPLLDAHLVDLAADVAKLSDMERLYAYALSTTLETTDREITADDVDDWNADQPATEGAAKMVRDAMTLDDEQWSRLVSTLASSMALA